MWKIQWKCDCEESVNRVEDLDAVLDRLNTEFEASTPALVVIESLENGDSLAIGLGRTLSVLNFVSGSGDPPYFTSVGSSDSDDTIEFDYMGEVSEFPIRNALAIDTARQAARDFFQEGVLPERVRWEQD